jgi:hypothetical protein
MISQATNLEIAKRVKADLVIGPDNTFKNLQRSGLWPAYAQPALRGQLEWNKVPHKKKIHWEPYFNLGSDEISLNDDHLAAVIVNLYPTEIKMRS